MSQERLNRLSKCTIKKDIWTLLISIPSLMILHKEMPKSNSNSLLNITRQIYTFAKSKNHLPSE